MRRLLWIALGLLVVSLAPVAHADDVTLDVSGTFDAYGVGESCSSAPRSCVLGGTIVFNNVTGAIISADVTFTGSSPIVGPFTSFYGIEPTKGGNTFLSLNDASGDFVLFDIPAPNQGSLVGYAGVASFWGPA